ncbi:MAG: rhomboid family intramembrane serine protease [bacterium]
MLIPLGTDRALHRWPVVTWVLIAVNILVFAGFEAYGRNYPGAANELFDRLALAGDGPTWYTFITSQFLHIGFMHIAGNMLVLWVFGPNVEDRFGRVGFLVFYLGAGVLAGGTHVVLEHAGAAGASGAIAGVTGAYIALFPRTSVRVFYWFFIFGVRWWPAFVFIGIAIARDVVFTGLGWSGNVATFAHMGGYAAGFAVAMALMATKVLPSEGLDLFAMIKQRRRRQEFREVVQGKRKVLPDAVSEALAAARARVIDRLSAGDAGGAAVGYGELLVLAGGPGKQASLASRQQQELGMLLMGSGSRALAADAFESFLLAYPKDVEGTGVRLLLALVCVNDLSQPGRAAQALEGITAEPTDGQQREVLAGLRARLVGSG